MSATASLQSASDPVRLLSAEFSARSQKNPRYSLRAFAKSLGLSHTILSLVLSGKRPLSRKAALQIAERLGMDPEKSARLIQREPSSLRPGRHATRFQRIDLDTFHVISDWVHYAILSLLDTEGAEANPKWIAKRLGINETLAKVSFERLASLGMIARAEGKWKQTGKPIKVENGISTAATRKFHRQLLEKALESLEQDEIELRDFSSITLALDPKHIPYAKERIRQFRRELCAELEAKGKPKEVYNLTVQIYPVSRGGGKP